MGLLKADSILFSLPVFNFSLLDPSPQLRKMLKNDPSKIKKEEILTLAITPTFSFPSSQYF